MNDNNEEIFYCSNCNFLCNDKWKWGRHIITKKHINYNNLSIPNIEKNTIITDNKVEKYINITDNKEYICSCGKKYVHRQSLYQHKQKCMQNNGNKPIGHDYIIQIIKQNNKLQEQLIELSKEKSITNNTNCNIQDNKFNLNFFLNEQCKNALNIKDFVSTLQLQLTDLEKTGDLGFVEGISKIFIKGLKELDVYKRPLHCSDLKRETLYIKDSDKWEKDNSEKDKLKGAIKEIASKNMKQLPEWIGKNPNCYDSSSKTNDKYLNIIGNSM